MSLKPGKKVNLFGLQKRRDLNGQQGVLLEYNHDKGRWGVELQDGEKVCVKRQNIETREMIMSQNVYSSCGFPNTATRPLEDFVEERMGPHGRGLFAKIDIPFRMYATDRKFRVSLTAEEGLQLHKKLEVFTNERMCEMYGEGSSISFEHKENWNMLSSYVGKCIQNHWLTNEFVQDLMNYNAFSPECLDVIFRKATFQDIMAFKFWCTQFPDVSANDVWRVWSFLLSHANLEDMTVTVGTFVKANCDAQRWRMYQMQEWGCTTKVHHQYLGGHFVSIQPWGRQKHVGRNQIPGDSCVIFVRDVRKGEEVLMDYGTQYFAPVKFQLKNTDEALCDLIFQVLEGVDDRVTEALEKHMRG